MTLLSLVNTPSKEMALIALWGLPDHDGPATRIEGFSTAC